MKLVKHRPRLTLRAPSEVSAGESFTLWLEVRAKREVPIEHLDLRFAGVDHATVPGGQNGVRYESSVLARTARILDEGTLLAGTQQHRVVIDLPEDAPPSYAGARAATQYVASARVSIPWWPDRTESWVIHVRRPPTELLAPLGVSYSSDPAGPRGTEPHVECSLADQRVVPGGVIEGSVALLNKAHNRYRAVRLVLVCREHCYDEQGRVLHQETALSFRSALPVESEVEGEAIPFRLKIPPNVPISHRSKLWKTEWLLEVTATVSLVRKLTIAIPLTVVPAGSKRVATERRAPPTVGSERITRMWQAVADELGMQLEGDVLRARDGDADVAIRRDHRGAEGIFLVARVRHPSAGIGLDGGLASGFRRVVGGGVSLGDAQWDRDHYVAGRDPEQIRAYGAVLFPQLRAHRVADWSDDGVVIELRDAGTTRKPLAAFAASALSIARAIPEALEAIPPPACFKRVPGAWASWRELAGVLDGRLDLGPMAVHGHVDGAPCAVITEWGTREAPAVTRFEVRTSQPIEEKHFYSRSGDVVRGDPTRLPRDARALLDALAEGAEGLCIEEGRIVSWLPAPLDSPDRAAPPRLRQMARVATLLRPQTGPFR